MRIADKMQYEQVRSNIGKNRSTMSDLQNQAATQKRVTKPSDDPLAASRVMSNRADVQSTQQYIKDIKYAKSFIDYTDQSLGDLSESLVRAKELAVGQSNDASANHETRRTVAAEVEQLHAAMVNIGNRKLGDRFIFGGFRTQTAPFDMKGGYHGDSGEMKVPIDKEAFVAMNVPGGRVFLGHDVTEPRVAKPDGPELPPPLTMTPPPGSRKGSEAEGAPAPASDRTMLDDGENIFRVVKDLETSLRTNDKEGIQESLNTLDAALNQVVLVRAQVGARATSLDNLTNTLEKNKVDNQVQISQLEDADVFNTVSEINKNQATLQATLQTSGKLVQPSLMDFLR